MHDDTDTNRRWRQAPSGAGPRWQIRVSSLRSPLAVRCGAWCARGPTRALRSAVSRAPPPVFATDTICRPLDKSAHRRVSGTSLYEINPPTAQAEPFDKLRTGSSKPRRWNRETQSSGAPRDVQTAAAGAQYKAAKHTLILLSDRLISQHNNYWRLGSLLQSGRARIVPTKEMLLWIKKTSLYYKAAEHALCLLRIPAYRAGFWSLLQSGRARIVPGLVAGLFERRPVSTTKRQSTHCAWAAVLSGYMRKGSLLQSGRARIVPDLPD